MSVCLRVLQLEASISYLEFCVHKLHNEERAIHNFLISTYIMSRQNQKLLSYLTEQSKVLYYIHIYTCSSSCIYSIAHQVLYSVEMQIKLVCIQQCTCMCTVSLTRRRAQAHTVYTSHISWNRRAAICFFHDSMCLVFLKEARTNIRKIM